MKKIVISILCLFTCNMFIQAQNFENILSASKEDASTYLRNYLQPVYKGIIYNLNGGWYHSGKTHKKYGFDITISANASFVPENDKTFTFNNSDYTFLKLQSGSSASLPTVMGQENNTMINVEIPLDASGNPIPADSALLPSGVRTSSFETIGGIENDMKDAIGVAGIPMAMVQLGLGLPSKTDIKLRFVPKVGDDKIKFNLLGIGIQHNLLQHFFKADKIPIIDVSLLGAFTSAKTIYTPQNSSIGVNQETEIKINAYTAQILANANLTIVNFYAGLGYTAGTASTKVKGDYTHTYNDVVNGSVTTTSVTLHDPININYELSGVTATLGMRLNLAWFKIFADYTMQEYNTVRAGIAFSVR